MLFLNIDSGVRMSAAESRGRTVGFRSARGPILLAVMLSTGLVAIDSTILATSVPTVVADIGGFTQFPWLFSIFLLTQSVTVPIYSKLADMIGRKPVMLVGVLIFLIASILCGIAWDMTSLIVFRALQGIGGGAILPISFTIIGDIYTVEERGRVQGYTASVWAIASVLGPTLGGVFSQFLTWRWIFFINIPLSLIAMWVLWRKYHESVERTKRSIDYAGAITLTIGLSALILALLEGGVAWEWLSPQTFGILSLGAVSLTAFVLIERRAREPILDLKLVIRPLILATAAVNLFSGAVTTGLSSFAPTYLENSIGVVPLISGLAVAALSLGWPVASSISAKVYMRIGFRQTAIIGSAVAAFGTALLAALAGWPNAWFVASSMFFIGFGMGWTMPPTLVAVQSSVRWNERGAATGVGQLARSVGSTIGVAIFGAISNGMIAAGRGEHDYSTIVNATQWVFIAAAIAAVLQLASAAGVPKHVVILSENPGDLPAGAELGSERSS